MKLTDPTVKNLRATSARQEIPDDLLPGLYLTVQPKTGAKSWQVRYRAAGKHRRMTLGRYPAMSLSAARDRARAVMLDAQSGADPAAEVRAAKQEAPRDTVAAALDDYAKRQLKKKKSGELMKRELDRFVRAELGERQLAKVTRIDLQDLIDDIADTGRGTTANRVLAYTKTFFAWAETRGLIDANPAASLKKAVKETPRDRVLSDAEILWFWRACDRVGFPWGDMAKMLLLTGQRLSEIAELTDREISGESLSFAATRTKNGRAHEVPLSIKAFDILEGIQRIKNPKGYIFTTNGMTPVQGFHKARQAIAKAMQEEAEKERGQPVEIDHWTFHDLRRTCATGMARDSRTVVIEKLLNHVSGTLAGVAGVYNRYEYAMEMRDAMDSWAARIDAILGNKSESGLQESIKE
jgi:integrase